MWNLSFSDKHRCKVKLKVSQFKSVCFLLLLSKKIIQTQGAVIPDGINFDLRINTGSSSAGMKFLFQTPVSFQHDSGLDFDKANSKLCHNEVGHVSLVTFLPCDLFVEQKCHILTHQNCTKSYQSCSYSNFLSASWCLSA